MNAFFYIRKIGGGLGGVFYSEYTDILVVNDLTLWNNNRIVIARVYCSGKYCKEGLPC